MTILEERLLSAFDGHDTAGVRAALEAGANATAPVNGKTPIHWLLEQYARSDRLKECVRLLFERGAKLGDAALELVLLDDGDELRSLLKYEPPGRVRRRVSLKSAFTSLVDVTLLHVAAEYGHRNAAEALIECGADVNARGRVDENGMNGHTPLFHTVNSNRNRSAPIMHILLEAGADCSIRLDGLWWGKEYPWETAFFDVTPISFAQMGLLPQVHRAEADIYANIRAMMEASGREPPRMENVPNRYLSESH
jgi:ankyrin repeat protein